jgi:flagellar FliJ protein
MKKFSYRLEPVLKSRSDKEEKAILAQSAAQREYGLQLEELERLQSNLDNICATGGQEMSAHDLTTRWLYIDFMKTCAHKQGEVVEKARRELERKRSALIKARQDRLVLEKHRDRLYENYMEDLLKWEEKMNDDQCTALAHRRKGGEIKSQS